MHHIPGKATSYKQHEEEQFHYKRVDSLLFHQPFCKYEAIDAFYPNHCDTFQRNHSNL